jgi:hypothetical protein
VICGNLKPNGKALEPGDQARVTGEIGLWLSNGSDDVAAADFRVRDLVCANAGHGNAVPLQLRRCSILCG